MAAPASQGKMIGNSIEQRGGMLFYRRKGKSGGAVVNSKSIGEDPEFEL